MKFIYNIPVTSENDQVVVTASAIKRDECFADDSNMTCHSNASSDGSCIASSVKSWLESQGMQYDTSLLA